MHREMAKDSSSEPSDSARAYTSAVIIANPTSGSHARQVHQMQETITFLRNAGWKVELQVTVAPGDASRMTREAVDRHTEVVIVAGGDGTINEVIQELAGSETVLGVLPAGTANVWARDTNIPLDYASAREVLVHGKTRRVDLGHVNGRYFLLMAGIGFDGEVTHAIEKKPIKRLGVVAYLLVGAWLGLGYESFRVYMTINGRLVKKHALQVVIGNTQLYGGAIKYTWQAKCDDGLLDVCILRKRTMLERIFVFVDFLLYRAQRHQWVSYTKCTSLNVRTRKPVAIQVDGEPFGYTPARFSIFPKALKVIVPQKIPQVFSVSHPSPQD
ncbi:MAG: diacylglycerol/lipid kinase family protein [Ktedonobacteraceae bacterium]